MWQTKDIAKAQHWDFITVSTSMHQRCPVLILRTEFLLKFSTNNTVYYCFIILLPKMLGILQDNE